CVRDSLACPPHVDCMSPIPSLPHKHDTALSCLLFFFNDTATTEIYTLSLHDALPILKQVKILAFYPDEDREVWTKHQNEIPDGRSEEHTSELQSRFDLVCRLLLEKKKAEK